MKISLLLLVVSVSMAVGSVAHNRKHKKSNDETVTATPSVGDEAPGTDPYADFGLFAAGAGTFITGFEDSSNDELENDEVTAQALSNKHSRTHQKHHSHS
ncbi:hypothetical protein evm_010080 [Chilo suppressalis]|nr:hypothetical protein evm_010080 [Chilo suppressalis]